MLCFLSLTDQSPFCATVIDSEPLENGEGAPACSSSFGGWEAHTRGIGSKLLAQMGYEFGKGKGRRIKYPQDKKPACVACCLIPASQRDQGLVPAEWGNGLTLNPLSIDSKSNQHCLDQAQNGVCIQF